MAETHEAPKHVREFVGQFERDEAPRRGSSRTRELVKAVIEAVDRDEEVKRAFDYARNWAKTSAVRRDAYDEYGKLHDPETEFGEHESPGVGLAASAGFLRAAIALEENQAFAEVKKRLQEPETLASDVRRGLSPAKEGFVGELILEAAQKRTANAKVAERIDEAKAEIESLIRDLGRDRERSDGPAAYGFLWEFGSEVMDAVVVGIAVVVVVVVIAAVIL